MKISDSNISMQSEHSSLSIYARKESLTAWRGNNRRMESSEEIRVKGDLGSHQLQLQSTNLPQVTISPQARNIQKVEAPTDETDKLDPRISLLKTVIEAMTGRKIHLIDTQDIAAASGGQGSGGGQVSNGAPSAGFGMIYSRSESYDEYEATAVSASGTIKTSDGREISFQLDLQMSRHYHEESNVTIRQGDANRKDPLVLNFGGTAAELQDQKFSFDLDGDGDKEKIAGFASNSGYLALDKNGNGKIDSGKELFGPATNSGFGELAQLDGDGNGWIDENDAAFKDLKIWMPDATGGKMISLKEAGVGAMALAHVNSQFELRGNGNSNLGAVRDTGVFLFEDGGVGSLQEIDLTV